MIKKILDDKTIKMRLKKKKNKANSGEPFKSGLIS